MPAEIRVPLLGESVVEATVGRWLKQVGDAVAIGESVVELETDKVNTEVPADEKGVIAQIVATEGTTVRPGDVLATVTAAGGARREEPGAAPPAPAAATTPVAAGLAENGDEVEVAAGDGARVRASSLAERLAHELGVDLSNVQGTGPGGRVMKDDVQAFAQRGPVAQQLEARGQDAAASAASTMQATPPSAASPSVTPSPTAAVSPPAASAAQLQPAALPSGPARPETRSRLSRRRAAIARRLVEAQRTAAMLTTFNEIDMSAVMALRAKRRDSFKERHGVGLGFMSFFTKACIGALKAFPQVNAELQDDELIVKHYYDIGIAIGDPEGLVVPVLRNADKLSFAQIEQAIQSFAKRARERALSLEDLRGGTFTITNGGIFGSLMSTPILNPPQVGILGMHKIAPRPVVVDGEVAVRPMMYVALSYDHRVVDGREAVQFLVRVKELVEDPEDLLLEG